MKGPEHFRRKPLDTSKKVEQVAKEEGREEDKVSETREEALFENMMYYPGNLELDDLTSAEGLTLPKKVDGIVYLSKELLTKELLKGPNLHIPDGVDVRSIYE